MVKPFGCWQELLAIKILPRAVFAVMYHVKIVGKLLMCLSSAAFYSNLNSPNGNSYKNSQETGFKGTFHVELIMLCNSFSCKITVSGDLGKLRRSG